MRGAKEKPPKHPRLMQPWMRTHRMLYRMVSLKSTVSCGTTPIAARNDACKPAGAASKLVVLLVDWTSCITRELCRCPSDTNLARSTDSQRCHAAAEPDPLGASQQC